MKFLLYVFMLTFCYGIVFNMSYAENRLSFSPEMQRKIATCERKYQKFIDTVIIKTKLTSPNDKKWEVYCEYLVIDDYTIEVIYSGSYNATHQLFRKYIH